MKTAMQDLKETIEQMINNGGTEEDLFAVISHIDNTYFIKEKKQIMNAFLEGKINHSKDWAIDYYNQTYNENK